MMAFLSQLMMAFLSQVNVILPLHVPLTCTWAGWRLGEWAVAEPVASLGLVPQVGVCLCLVVLLVILHAHLQSACLGAGAEVEAEAFTCASHGLRERIGGKEQINAWLYTVSADILGEFPHSPVRARTRNLHAQLVPASVVWSLCFLSKTCRACAYACPP